MKSQKLHFFKLLILLFLMIGMNNDVVNAQVTVTITATGTAGSYATGSVNSGGTKNDGAMVTINSSSNRGWAVFDLSTIPSGAIINSVTLRFTTYSSTSSTATNNVYGYQYTVANDPATVAGASLYTSLGSGTSLNASSWSANALQTKTLNATAITLVSTNIGGKVIMGFVRGSTNTYNIYGYDGVNAADRPQIDVNFTATAPCSGTPNATTIAGPSAICPNASFTLTPSGQSFGNGISYQWQSSPPGAGTFSPIPSATTTPYVASSGITTATDYRLVTTCANGGGQDISNVLAVTVNPFYNCYCTPVSTCTNEGVENVTMGTLNNNSTFCNNTSGYSDYGSLGSVATVVQAQIVPISVTSHVNSTPSSAGVWIDYDHNGTFDATEFTNLGNFTGTFPTGGTSYTYTGNITISPAALTGITRMRVRGVNSGGITNTSSCISSNAYGEFEDYLITINAGTACLGTPVAGTAAASQSTVYCASSSFQITASGYSSGTTGLSYQWQESPNNSTFTDAGTAMSTYAPYAVAGISQSTYYRLKVTCTASGNFAATPGVLVTLGYAPIPWSEGFESLTTLSTTSFPSCWVKENGDWSSTNETTYNTSHNGTKYIRDAWSATNEYIWTPVFQLTAGTSYDFAFFVQADGYTGWNVDVFRNSTQSSVGAVQLGVTYSPTGPDATVIQPYNQRTYSFIPPSTGAYSFGVRVNQPSSTPWYLAFDDFTVNVTPSCPIPDALVSNITSQSANVSWTTTGTSFVVEYGLTGFTPGTGATAGSGSSTVITSATSPVSINGLSPLTGYSVYMRQNCTGTGFSPNSPVATFTSNGPEPVNNDCGAAIPLSVGNGFATDPLVGTLQYGTSEGTAAPSCQGTVNPADVWYSVTIPASGNVIVQTSAMNTTVTDLVMVAYSGTCGSLTEVGCDDDGNPDPGPSANHSRISLTGQTPNSVILFRVLGYGSATTNVGPFAISAWDPTVLPSVSPGGNCIAATPVNFSSVSGNLYRWVPLSDASNNIVGEIYANGNAMGTVNASVYTNPGTIRSSNSIPYLDRNITITPTTQPTSSVDVRLYILNSELAALQAADAGVTGLGSLNISKTSTLCQSSITAADAVLTQTGNTTYGANGDYVQFSTSSFSTLFLRGGTTPLPLKLISFKGQNKGAVNSLVWETAEEVNFSHFELQRSADGIDFSKLDIIKGKNVTTGSIYNYTDNRPIAGENFYRLLMFDRDGSFIMSNVVDLITKVGAGLSVTVHPNPVSNLMQINIAGKVDGKATILILDIVGKVIKTIEPTGTNIAVDMGNMPAGTYIVKYLDNSNSFVTKISKN